MNAEKNTEQLDIDIPPGALTTCPDKSYKMVGIKHCCVKCPYSLGLFMVTRQDLPFDQKYRVRCGVPQVREIIMVDLGGTA